MKKLKILMLILLCSVLSFAGIKDSKADLRKHAKSSNQKPSSNTKNKKNLNQKKKNKKKKSPGMYFYKEFDESISEEVKKNGDDVLLIKRSILLLKMGLNRKSLDTLTKVDDLDLLNQMYERKRVLEYFVEQCSMDHMSFVSSKVVLDYAFKNTLNGKGLAHLYASFCDDMEVLDILKSKNAPMDFRDSKGHLPIEYAILTCNKSFIAHSLSRGFGMWLSKKKQNALVYWAKTRCDDDIAKNVETMFR